MTTTLSRCQCATRAHQQWTQAWEELQSSTYSVLRSQQTPEKSSMAQYRLALPRERHRSRPVNLARGPDPHDQECEAGKHPTALERTEAGGIYQFLTHEAEGLCGMDREAALQFHMAVYSEWADEHKESDAENVRQRWQIIKRTRRLIKAYRSVQNDKLNSKHLSTVLNVSEEQLRAVKWDPEYHQLLGSLREDVVDETRSCTCGILLGVLALLEVHAAWQHDAWVALFSAPSTDGTPIEHGSANPTSKRRQGTR